MTIEIETLKSKQNNIAFCYSTKDRDELTTKTFPMVLDEEGDFDIYWIDASEVPASQKLGHFNTGKICEVHHNVKGGADVAILYNLSLLLEKGYDYIGLIENDVLLEKGWFKKTFELFEKGRQDGLKVGSTSARSYKVRVHVPRDGYAVMKNVGAGMQILTAEAAKYVLQNFHTGTFGEPSFLFANYTGIGGIIPWQLKDIPPEKQTNKWQTCADWFFEASMLPYGLATLALTPSMAKNIDDKPVDDTVDEATKADPNFDWLSFRTNYNKNEIDDCGTSVVKAAINHYDPVFKEWRAFPHQIVKALPVAFSGKWRVKWTQFDGPFSFVTNSDDAAIEIPFSGTTMQIVYENGKNVVSFNMSGTCGNGVVEIAEEEGKKCINVGAKYSGPHFVKVNFNQPGILISYFHFEGPQKWMKSKYNLRYKDLEPFLQD